MSKVSSEKARFYTKRLEEGFLNPYIFVFIRIHVGRNQCGPGLNPEVDAICELSSLLVLSFAPRGFSPSAPEKKAPDSSKFRFDLEGEDTFQPVLRSAPCG